MPEDTDTDTLTWEEASAEAQPLSFEDAQAGAKKIAEREGAQVLSPLQLVGEGMGKLGRAAEKAFTPVANLPTELINLGAGLAGRKDRLIEPRFKEGESMLPKGTWEHFKENVERALRPSSMFDIPSDQPTPLSEGGSKAITKATEGMTTPGMVGTLMLAPGRVVTPLFAAGAVAALPESLQKAVDTFKDPNATAAQKVEAASGTALDALFAALMTHGGLTQSEAVKQFKEAGLEPPGAESARAPVEPAETPKPEVTPDKEIEAGINRSLAESPKAPEAIQPPVAAAVAEPEPQPQGASAPEPQRVSEPASPIGETPPVPGAPGDVLSNIQKLARLPVEEFAPNKMAAGWARMFGEDATTPEHLEGLRRAEDQAAAAAKAETDPAAKLAAKQKQQFFTEAIRAAAPRVAAKETGFALDPVARHGGNWAETEPDLPDEIRELPKLLEFSRPSARPELGRDTVYIPEGSSYEEIVDALQKRAAAFLKGDTREATFERAADFDPAKVQTREVPVADIGLSADVPNFKIGADPETGVVPGHELGGKYQRLGTGPIIVWRRNNGALEVITGRHRLELARRSGEKTIPAQVVDEAGGFTREMALTADAEANIREGQGTTEDYAHYFKHTAGLTEEAARSRGLLGNAKGRAGWDLGKNASDDLQAAWQAGKTTEAQALEIARAATGNAAAQQIGLKFALQGKPPEFLANVVKAAMSESGGRERALDLFGRDDSAMRAMEAQAKRAGTLQADLRAQIAAASGAAKNPEAARKLGVDVNDPASVKARVQQLRGELVRWENWPLHPDLVAKVKGVSAPASEKPAPETPAPVAPAPKLGSGQKQGDLIASTQREDLSLAGEKGTDAERLAAEKARSEKSAAEARALAEKQQQPLAGMGAAVPGEFTAGAHTATGIKNATVDSERARRGLPPAMEPARRSFGKVWDEAMALVDHDPAAQDNLIDELRTKPRALTDLEDALLLHRQLDLQNDYGKATRDLAQAFDDGRAEDVEREKLRVAGLSDRLLALYDLGKAAGTETGRGLNARKMMAYEDFTLAKMMLDKRSANNGKPLTADQQQELTAAHEKIAATQKAFDEYRAAAESRQAETAANQAVTEMKAETAREPRGRGSRPQPTPEDLAASIRNRLEKGADVTELGTLIQRLARAFVRAGVKERVPLVDAVHGVLKPLLPDLEWRETQDAISGYGDFRQLSQDEISKQLRDLKGQMQQTSKLLDLFQREPPSKTGFERRTPTDVERRLIQQVNEAKKRFGVETTDPAAQLKSALQSVKTRLRNQIADLEDQIRTKTKTVSDRAPAPEDAESQGLKARRDELKKEFDEIFGRPELTDEQRVKRALAGVERQSAEIERQIKEGDIFPGRPSRTPTTPELAAARANRDALVSQRDYLRESIQPTERLTPEQRTLKALKTRLAKRTAELQAKLAAGDFSTRARRTVALDAEGLRLKALNEKAKTDFQRGLVADRLKNRTRLEKFQDTFVKWRRAGLLSSPITLAKLTMAAAQRFAFTPLEEAAGGLISQAVPQLAERAPSEGGFNARAEARALTEGLTTGMADAAQILRTGHSDLERVHGNISPLPREWIDFIGELHGALKAPVLRNAFARSFEKRSAFAIRNGVDVSDPLVQTRLAAEAFQDARRAIFMQDNRVVNAYKAVLGRLEAKSKVTGRTPTAGKIGATVARTLLPIVKVPTNIVAETMQYAAGSVTGSARLANAFRKGIETLPPEHADLIMRELKKGSLGAAVMLLGFLAPTAVGGYYQAGEKRKAADVKAGSIQAFGVNVPGFLLHNPLLETAQLGATVRRVADSKLNKHDRERQGITEGLLAGALGLAEDAPFVRDMVETSKAFNPHERGAFFGELGKSFVPQVAQWAARELDKDQQGRKLNRQPKTALQRVESGIPGLRQNVPINRKQPFQTP